jgi:hypothetical protein
MTDNVADINAILGGNFQEYKNTDGIAFGEQIGGEWPPVKELAETAQIPKINLVDKHRQDPLTQLAIEVSESVQFPVNTAFLHGLGCIASAMNKSFHYEYYGSEAPVTLYCLSSQPPSTGKSQINNIFTKPIRLAYADLNKEQAKKRMALEIKIEAATKEMANQKKANDAEAMADIACDLANLKGELDSIPVYKYSVSNATPEALEKIAFNQLGIFNVISDEAGSINTLLGLSYSDKATKNNADLVLQGWDGDYMSSARITRDSAEGFVRGCVSVIAQDETIDAILQAGERGNGVSERFLLMKENNLFGLRDHFKEQRIDGAVLNRYSQLVNGLVNSEKTVFKISDDAKVFIKQKKQELEPMLADNGRYSNSMMRGAIGKMDKQVHKIASVLHVVEHFFNGSAPVTISVETFKWAYSVYSELAKMYECAAEEKGYTGELAELKAVVTQLSKLTDKGKYEVKPRQLRDSLRNLKIFKGKSSFTNHLSDVLIPRCEALNYCRVFGDVIKINPSI